MRTSRLCALIAVLFSLVFCSDKSSESVYPAVIEIIDSVKTVKNPDFPRDGIVSDVLVEELSIGLDEGPEEYMFNRPFDVKVAEDGSIFVLDWGDITIKVYDKDGAFLRTIGQEGQGPGDLGFLLYFDLSSDGRIFVMNTVNRNVTLYSVTGEYLGSFSFEGSANDMRTDGQNRLYYTQRTRKTKLEELPLSDDFMELDSLVQIFRNDAEGHSLKLMGEFEGEKDRIKRTGEENYFSLSSQFNIVWQVNAEGYIFAGLNKDFVINKFDPEGNKVLSFGRDYEPVTQIVGPKDDPRERIMPAYDSRRGWKFDEKGNLWVSTFSERPGEVIYDIFSPEGIYIKQVILPCRICQIKNGKIYSIVTNEEGYMTVKRFGLMELGI